MTIRLKGKTFKGNHKFGSNVDPRSPYQEGMSPSKKNLLVLCGFLEETDTVIRSQLCSDIEASGIPIDMHWGI